MKIIKISLIVIAALAVIFVSIYSYYGGLSPIEFRNEIQGGETVVYEKVQGNYSQTPKIQNKIYESLKNNEGIETTSGFGIYYDDPHKVEKSQLRSDVGCILDNVDSIKMVELSTKYQIKTLTLGRYLVAEFPYKGQLSVWIGIMNVYPAFREYIKEHGLNAEGAITEIYDIPNKTIIYRKEIR